MMRTMFVAVAVVCIATVLSESLGLALLWYRGQLTSDSIRDIRLVLSGQTATGLQPADDETAVSPTHKEIARERTIHILNLSAREEELSLLQQMLEERRAALRADQSDLEQAQAEFDARLEQLQDANTAGATERSRAILAALAPADAVAELMPLPLDDNVMLLEGMAEKSVAKLLQEFLDGGDDERKRGLEIFRAMSEGGAAGSLIGETLAAPPDITNAAN